MVSYFQWCCYLSSAYRSMTEWVIKSGCQQSLSIGWLWVGTSRDGGRV